MLNQADNRRDPEATRTRRVVAIALLCAFVFWVSGGALAAHDAVAHGGHAWGATRTADATIASAHGVDGHGHAAGECPVCHMLVHGVALASSQQGRVHFAHAAMACEAVPGSLAVRWFALSDAAPRGPPSLLP